MPLEKKESVQNDRKVSKVIYFFIGFFAIFITVNIFYIYLSKTTWRGLVTEGYYRKGVHYNEVLKQAELQKKLGWKVEIRSRRRGDKRISIMVSAADKNNRQLKDADIYITFKRPTQEGYDFSEKILFVDGVYQKKVTFPMKGQWDLHISVVKGKDTYQEVKRFVFE